MNLIQPKIFTDIDGVSAIFTKANRNVVNQKGEIPGLNLGNNTSAGDAEIKNNKRDLFKLLDWDLRNLASANQVHGDNIKVVDKPGLYSDYDGLITREKGLILSIHVADCAAVLVSAKNGNIVGAFHAGWKGAAKGIIGKGLKKMKSLNNDESSYCAYISPCISQKSFEVGEEVAQLFPDRVVERASYSKPHIDLKKFIIDELKKEGLKEDDIEYSKECTFENHDLYSYRRERHTAGRMLAMIKMNKS